MEMGNMRPHRREKDTPSRINKTLRGALAGAAFLGAVGAAEAPAGAQTHQESTAAESTVDGKEKTVDSKMLMFDANDPIHAMASMERFIREYKNNVCEYSRECRGAFEAAYAHLIRAIALNPMIKMAAGNDQQAERFRQQQFQAIELANEQFSAAIEKYKPQATADSLELEARYADADGKTETARILRERARAMR